MNREALRKAMRQARAIKHTKRKRPAIHRLLATIREGLTGHA